LPSVDTNFNIQLTKYGEGIILVSHSGFPHSGYNKHQNIHNRRWELRDLSTTT